MTYLIHILLGALIRSLIPNGAGGHHATYLGYALGFFPLLLAFALELAAPQIGTV